MSTILIRRGWGAPGTGVLSSNELGWDTVNNALYMGVDASDPIKIVDAFQDYLSIDQSTGVLTSTADLAAVNLALSGNLTVQGTTTTLNTTDMTVEDPILTLGESPLVADSKDRGVDFNYGSTGSPLVGFFGYDTSLGRFNFVPDATNTAEVIAGDSGNYQIGEIYQTQTGGVYDVGGISVNASARWNASSNLTETINIYLVENAVQTVTNPTTTVYNDTYNIQFVQVYLNRMKLRKTEYTATNGTSVDISYPLEIGDEIEIVTTSIA